MKVGGKCAQIQVCSVTAHTRMQMKIWTQDLLSEAEGFTAL